jgi:hypothetical protein
MSHAANSSFRIHHSALIEDWLPFDVIGAESLRDASAAQKPPLNRLHVWWARRPLTISRAAILASLLPAWGELKGRMMNDELVTMNSSFRVLHSSFPTENAYRAWFLRLLGIHGDPVAARKLLRLQSEGRIELKSNPYTHARAFTVNPTAEDLALLERILTLTWGDMGNDTCGTMSSALRIPHYLPSPSWIPSPAAARSPSRPGATVSPRLPTS